MVFFSAYSYISGRVSRYVMMAFHICIVYGGVIWAYANEYSPAEEIEYLLALCPSYRSVIRYVYVFPDVPFCWMLLGRLKAQGNCIGWKFLL